MPYHQNKSSQPYRQPPTRFKHHSTRKEELQQKRAEQQQMRNQYRPAQSISEFKDLQGIGQGAFAQVFKAYELMSAADAVVPTFREVALKRINLTAINDQAVLRTTLNEVNLFKELEHEHIVRCYYSFEETSPHSNYRYLALVMEYVDGGDLEKYLKNQLSTRTMLHEYKLWTIFAQITDALTYIHSKRIIHRDLKPANVLMMEDETIKLADFGLSRLQKVAETSAKTVCGTPYYMAPERIGEEPYRFKSDIWSVGCILYEMATLKSPFCGEKDNAASLIEKIRMADYPPLPQDCYNVQVGMVIDICLQPQFQKRPPASELYRVAATMAHRLAPWAPNSNSTTPNRRRQRNPLPITPETPVTRLSQ